MDLPSKQHVAGTLYARTSQAIGVLAQAGAGWGSGDQLEEGMYCGEGQC